MKGGDGIKVELYFELGRLYTLRHELRAAMTASGTPMKARSPRGPESIQTINAALELGQHLCSYSQCLEAHEVLRPAAEAGRKRMANGDFSWVPMLVIAWRGAAEVRSGALEVGTDELASILRESAALSALPPPVHAYIHVLMAEALILSGETVTVDAELDKAETIAASNGVKDARIHVNATDARLTWPLRYEMCRLSSATCRNSNSIAPMRMKAGNGRRGAGRSSLKPSWPRETMRSRLPSHATRYWPPLPATIARNWPARNRARFSCRVVFTWRRRRT